MLALEDFTYDSNSSVIIFETIRIKTIEWTNPWRSDRPSLTEFQLTNTEEKMDIENYH